ncbi:MAG: DUF4956 domain-containing protein [Actinomycetia bacterium]|nr:DUF4956 domain-containing protein [Actinomycetes bacterium]
MSTSTLFAIDLVAISVLAFGLYFPRHRRKDLIVAYLGVNVGVLAVANALASTEASTGLGLGLFGVLSIIRLRSAELDQTEVAYFFASLSLGLLGGIAVSPPWLTPVCMAVIVGVVFVADHPRLFAAYRRQTMVLDRAFTDELTLITHLETLLNASVRQVTVRKVDMVRDTTTVEVRYQLPSLSNLDGSHDALPSTAEFQR